MGIDCTITVTIDRPTSAVFEVLSDPARLAEWQPLVEHVEVLDGGPGLRQGSRVREVRRAGPRRLEQVVEVAAYDPPWRLDLRIVDGPVPIHGDIRLAPAGDDATEVSVRAFGRAPRALRVLEPVLAPFVKRQLRRQYRALKAVVEGTPHETGRARAA